MDFQPSSPLWHEQTVLSLTGGAVNGGGKPVAANQPTVAIARAGGRDQPVILIALLGFAAGLRLFGLFHDLPWSFYGDELHLVKRAMAMGTGDLNPHWFTKPAGLLYLLLALYGTFYLVGAALGHFASPEVFGAFFLSDQGPFLLLGRLLVFAFGLATVPLAWVFVRCALGAKSAAFAVAAVVAVLPPLVIGSQYVKEDVPSAAFALAGLWFLLRAGRGAQASRRLSAAAGVLFGLSTATKFYGILFLPAALIWLLQPRRGAGLRFAADWRAATVFLMAFSLTTFAATPFSFLDPVSRTTITERITSFIAADTVAFAPDHGVQFSYGPQAIPGALFHVLALAVEPVVAGPLLLPLAAFGGLICLRRPAHDGLGWLLFLPILGFLLLAVTVHAYHPSPRHFVAILPLLVILAWFGALGLAEPLARRLDWPVPRLAAILLLLAAMPNAWQSISATRELAKLDSRVVAGQWIRDHLPRDARILLDDYGPVLTPSPPAAARQLAILETLPPGEAFTAFQRERLSLLIRYPSPTAFDVDELGHPWWWPHELSEEVIRATPRHRRMSNPLKLYEPPTLAELRARGYAYVITNDSAAGRYLGPTAARDFPSYVRFYAELKALPILARFDPAAWDGKGPVVTIYKVR